MMGGGWNGIGSRAGDEDHMLLIGADYLEELVEQGGFYSAKVVFNAKGAIFFPVNQEHRNQKASGISYEDNYKGNALGRGDVT